MEAYLDNAATTVVKPEVVQKMNEIFLQEYGNPSSMHTKGMLAENEIKAAKKQLCGILKCEPDEIVFTSGGTESNNMALIGSALANRRRGKHIISTRTEHASVYNPLIFLENEGFEVTYIGVDHSGRVNPEDIRAALRDDTILVSVMQVNNEIGAVNDVETIGQIVHSFNKEIIFHVDSIQAFGKLPVVPKNMNADLVSVSSHKFHGPKGCGFLYIKQKTKIKPIIYGGEQQKGMRSGTENVPGVAGMCLAAQMIYNDLNANRARMFALKKHLIEGLSKIDGVTVHGLPEDDPANIEQTAPHIVSAGFKGVRSEVLLHALEERGVYVSSGSACSSNHPAISGTLKAAGVANDLLDSTLRFSFSTLTTEEEIDAALKALNELLPMLRRFIRK